MKETWKWIDGFEGKYEISDAGRVRSWVRKQPIILKPYTDKYGYKQVCLGRRFNTRVHQLVAKTFILNPRNLSEINHLDANSSNKTIWSGLLHKKILIT
jgi:hypothetical protein